MFRNVRTEPRKFSFQSRHLPELDDEWLQRKERIEQEVQGADGTTRRNIRMRRGSASSGSERLGRRTAQIKSSRWAMLRSALIAVGFGLVGLEGVAVGGEK